MRLSRFFQLAVKFGRDRDVRKGKEIKAYPDTAILYGRPDTLIRSILVGIDIEVPELLLADKIRSAQGLDLVIAHHPEGRAYAALHEVMQLQVDLLAKIGVERKVAQELLDERMREVERRILPNNHTRPVDAARLLDLPFICVHTPADNHVSYFMHRLLDKEKPKAVKDIVEILKEIPEYQDAMRELAGPRIILGNPKGGVGRISLEMTGGTEGSKEVFGRMYKAGIRTLVCMHLGEEHFKKAKDENLNVVIAGHISSDNLGLNLILDRIEKEAGEEFRTVNCSGFRRIRRY